MDEKPVVIVGGLGRCGSSLTMAMIAAGGVPVIGAPPAFEDETFNRDLTEDQFRAASGRAVKMLMLDRFSVPFDAAPCVMIWTARDRKDQAQSQAKFLEMVGGIAVNRAERRALHSRILPDTRTALLKAEGIPRIVVDFGVTLRHPEQTAGHIANFLRPWWEMDRAAMRTVVIPRSSRCQPDMSIEKLLVMRTGGV